MANHINRRASFQCDPAKRHVFTFRESSGRRYKTKLLTELLILLVQQTRSLVKEVMM